MYGFTESELEDVVLQKIEEIGDYGKTDILGLMLIQGWLNQNSDLTKKEIEEMTQGEARDQFLTIKGWNEPIK